MTVFRLFFVPAITISFNALLIQTALPEVIVTVADSMHTEWCEDDSIRFVSELWPGEGIPVFRSKRTLSMYTEPSRKAEISARLSIPPNVVLNILTTQYQTIEPVEVTVEHDRTIQATDYGTVRYLSKDAYYRAGVRKKLELHEGRKIEVLQYRAEGTYFIAIDNTVYSVGKFWEDENPSTDWWIKTEYGAKEGWVLIDRETIEFLPRKF